MILSNSTNLSNWTKIFSFLRRVCLKPSIGPYSCMIDSVKFTKNTELSKRIESYTFIAKVYKSLMNSVDFIKGLDNAVIFSVNGHRTCSLLDMEDTFQIARSVHLMSQHSKLSHCLELYTVHIILSCFFSIQNITRDQHLWPLRQTLSLCSPSMILDCRTLWSHLDQEPEPYNVKVKLWTFSAKFAATTLNPSLHEILNIGLVSQKI